MKATNRLHITLMSVSARNVIHTQIKQFFSHDEFVIPSVPEVFLDFSSFRAALISSRDSSSKLRGSSQLSHDHAEKNQGEHMRLG